MPLLFYFFISDLKLYSKKKILSHGSLCETTAWIPIENNGMETPHDFHVESTWKEKLCVNMPLGFIHRVVSWLLLWRYMRPLLYLHMPPIYF